MRAVVIVALVLSGAAEVFAQPAAAPADPKGQAYFEFLLARRLESQGDTDGAQQALQRALTLDPKSAELNAELAGFYARQNKANEAVD